jgi:peptidoglycan/LPS O-acetylase OafA/YrhL
MGLLRLFLALSVIAGHTQSSVFGFHGINSQYAVNCFFIISGFYMSMVLNGKYKNTKPINFYKSRALRLFPVYYVGVLIALVVSFDNIHYFFDSLSLGARFFFVFQNLFIFGQDLSYLLCAKTLSSQCANPIGLTINPPAWSLAVELIFYLIAPYVLKSTKKTFVFILLGCGYLLSINKIYFPLSTDTLIFLSPVNFTAFNYYFYPSSFIFFGGGALAYHLKQNNSSPHYFAAIIAIISLSFTQTIMPFWHLLFVSMAIPVLFDYTATNRIDRIIGELSYPAYILHFPILLFLKPFTLSHPEYFNFIGFGSWTAFLSCTMGILLYFTIEKKVNQYRTLDLFFDSHSKSKCDFVMQTFTTGLLFIFLFLPIATITYIYSVQYLNPHPLNHSITSKEKIVDDSFFLTDDNWQRGIARNWTGFFVPNTKKFVDQFKTGKIVKFINGESREITQVTADGLYLNIYLNGIPLNPEKVGLPIDFTIMDKLNNNLKEDKK